MPHAVTPEQSNGFDPTEPIAVVGMAMRFPGGATDSKRFWDSKFKPSEPYGTGRVMLWTDNRLACSAPKWSFGTCSNTEVTIRC